MRREPNERWLAVKAATERPTHPIEGICWDVLQKYAVDSKMSRALEIYETQFERERMQAWLISGTTDQDIYERTMLSINTIEAYRHLFFNPDVFRDQLDRQYWVGNFEKNASETGTNTPYGALLLKKAHLHGVEALAQALGTVSHLEPTHIIEQMMRLLFFRSQTILASDDVKGGTMERGLEMAKMSLDIAHELSKSRPSNMSDVIIKLKKREMTQNVEDVMPRGEVLH